MVGESKSDVAERVLQAAKEVFFARGFHNSSLRAIAKRAGTSESGVLRFYQGKLHLLQCVYASCWTEVNASVDEALAIAAKQDPDPRNLLLQLMRSLLDDYHAAEPMMHFMLTTFGFQETTGYPIDSGDIDNDADSEARRQYHRYLTVVNDLCDTVVAAQPVFARAGITGAGLAHMFLATVNGIQADWYRLRLEPGLDRPQLTTEEALNGMRLFLYREATGA